jgi:hypothetical protein
LGGWYLAETNHDLVTSLAKRSLEEKLPSLREIDNDGLKWGSEEGIGTVIERVE